MIFRSLPIDQIHMLITDTKFKANNDFAYSSHIIRDSNNPFQEGLYRALCDPLGTDMQFEMASSLHSRTTRSEQDSLEKAQNK